MSNLPSDKIQAIPPQSLCAHVWVLLVITIEFPVHFRSFLLFNQQRSTICLEMIWNCLLFYSRVGFPGGSNSKESTCNAGDLASIPGLGRSPGGGHRSPLQYSCLENPHGQRSLGGYSLWGHRVGHNWMTKHSTVHASLAYSRAF